MNNFFKMSLVAAAVAVSGTATAGIVTPTASVFSVEGVAITTATAQLAGGFVYKTKTDYEAGAEVTFTYSAGAIASNSVFPASIDSVASGVIGEGTGTMTLTKSSQTADSVTYKVTAKQGTGSVLGNTITVTASNSLTTVNGVLLNTSAIKAGPVTVKVSAQYQGVAFDPDTTTATDSKANYLASTATQFGKYSVKVPLAGEIVVSSGSLGKTLVSADTLTMTYTPKDNSSMKAVIGDATDSVNKLGSIVVTGKSSVAGLFAGMTTTEVVGTGATTAMTSKGFDLSQTITASTSSVTPIDYTAVITPTTAANSALSLQSFNVTPVISYAGGTVESSTMGAGKWTVDAEMATVTYMPYGTGVTQIIYLTNTGTADAKVAVTATDENGVKYALGTLATAKGNGQITKITEEVRAALLAQGFSKGKVALDFMFVGVASGLSAPAVKVYSAYNVNGTDRGFVANTTNGAK